MKLNEMIDVMSLDEMLDFCSEELTEVQNKSFPAVIVCCSSVIVIRGFVA